MYTTIPNYLTTYLDITLQILNSLMEESVLTSFKHHASEQFGAEFGTSKTSGVGCWLQLRMWSTKNHAICG